MGKLTDISRNKNKTLTNRERENFKHEKNVEITPWLKPVKSWNASERAEIFTLFLKILFLVGAKCAIFMETTKKFTFHERAEI